MDEHYQLEAEERLDAALDSWKLPGRSSEHHLRERVWSRLAIAPPCPRHEISMQDPGSWIRSLLRYCEHPAIAAGVVVTCILAGVLWGQVRVSQIQEERGVRMAENYLRLIDPFINENPVRENRP